MGRWALALLLFFPAGLFAHGEDHAALKEEVSTLTNRVEQLEQMLEVALQRLEAVDEASGETSQKTSRSTITVGGRVKADLLASSVNSGAPGGASRSDTAFLPARIPIGSIGEDNEISASARDSRFWINARTPTRGGELGAYLELDFVSSDGSGNERVTNSYNPRLRHAYGTFRDVTVGQTTTTFLNVLSFPELNDATGPVGILNVRQPLVRYTRSSDGLRWAFALEQPETTLVDTTGTREAIDDDRVPDIIGRIDIDRDWGNFSLALLLRQLRVSAASLNEVATGAGVSVSGRVFTGDADNLRFGLTYGEGIGRYLSYNAFDDVILRSDGSLDAIAVFGGYIAYQHWWHEHLRSNWAIGLARADMDDLILSGDFNESFVSSHLNLLWSPVPEATIGIEWLYGKRKLTSGLSGDLNRVQITSLYKFRRR